MQYRHPMQRLASTRTTPALVGKVAPTGQTWTQGGCAHWLHSLGTKKVLRTSRSSSGAIRAFLPGTLMLSTVASPSLVITYGSTQVRKKDGSFGTSFSALQASTQRLQPMHLSISIPMP